MASSALAFDLSTAYLDQPSFIAYGLVRGAGNLVMQHQMADKTTVAFYVLGEGPWDSLVRLWVNRKPIALPSALVHFHPGLDGEIGNGMTATSTGGDQHVDTFWSNTTGLSYVTFSRYAWLALKIPPDKGAPSASLEVLGDYQAMKVRIFDNTGAQTAFQWTQNPAWWIADRIIRRFVLREAKVNQPLIAAERARFDWQSFVDAAAYYDEEVPTVGSGIKRFSDGGVVFLDGSLTEDRILEQMLLMCRSYILERSGKISLYADKPRASVFTFDSDNVQPGTFTAKKANLRGGKNRINSSWRELARASGSSDDATRFSIAARTFNHEAHQRAIGVRGPGLSLIPKSLDLALDFGNNTAERVYRLTQFQLVRQLGDDADANMPYQAPFTFELTSNEESLAVEPGDVCTIDRSLSEEFAATDCEVLEIEERPDGTRAIVALEYQDSAFIDVAPTLQAIEAPVPGNGLASPLSLDANNNLQLDPTDDVFAKKGSVPPSFGPGLTYSSTTNSITWTWDYRSPNQLYRTDSQLTQLSPHNSQAVTGLSAATSYKFHPYYDEGLGDVSMLVAGGTGTPAWAHAATSRAKVAEMFRQDHVPLSDATLSAATTSSGSGGGSGGGDSGCLREGMFVKERKRGIIRAELLRAGDEIWGERERWVRVLRVRIAPHSQWVKLNFTNGARLVVTAGHPFTLADGSMCRAALLSLESEIPCPSGVAFPTAIRCEIRKSEKVSISCEEPHTFYASADRKEWVLTHNILHPTL